MPKWWQCLCRWASLHNSKERFRDAARYAYRSCKQMHRQRSLDPVEPRLLLSGTIDGHIYADGDRDGQIGVVVPSAYDRDEYVQEQQGQLSASKASGSDLVETVTKDEAEDKLKDKLGKEKGLKGWTVYVDEDLDGAFDAGELYTETDDDGSFVISGLEAGTYDVGVVREEGWLFTEGTNPVQTVVVNDDSVATVDSGVTRDAEGVLSINQDKSGGGEATLDLAEIGLPAEAAFMIDWGDGTLEKYDKSKKKLKHDYGHDGLFRVRIVVADGDSRHHLDDLYVEVGDTSRGLFNPDDGSYEFDDMPGLIQKRIDKGIKGRFPEYEELDTVESGSIEATHVNSEFSVLSLAAPASLSSPTTTQSLAASSSAATEGPVELLPTADAYVRDGNYSGDSFGFSEEIIVKSANSGYNRQTFMTFDVAALANTPSAILRLTPVDGNVNAANADVVIEVVEDDSWHEYKLTNQNKPAASGGVVAQATGAQIGVPMDFDITSAVQAAATTGDGVLSLRVSSIYSGDYYEGISFASREHTNASQRPKLIATAGVPDLSISTPQNVEPGVSANYTFSAAGATQADTQWHIDWGDGSAIQTAVGTNVSLAHTYVGEPSNYDIRAIATDPRDGRRLPGEVSYETIALSQNPLSYWRMGEVPTDTTMADETALADGTYTPRPSGHGWEGRPPELAQSSWLVGDLNASADLNPAYSRVSHDDAMLLDNGTISFWMKDETGIHDVGLVSKDAAGYETGGHIAIFTKPDSGTSDTSGYIQARMQASDGSGGGSTYTVGSSSDNNIEENWWHHVAFSWGSQGMQLYVDGQLVATNSYTGGLGTTSGGAGNFEDLILGAHGGWDPVAHGYLEGIGDSFSGLMDEVAIFDAQLSDSQILDQYFAEAVTATVEVSSGSSPVTLVEDTALITTNQTEVGGYEATFTVPASPDGLQVDFSNLMFDSAGGNPGDVNDAFELLLVDPATGESLVPVIGANSDAFFNFTQGQTPYRAQGVALLDDQGSVVDTVIDAGSVILDISGLTEGQEVELIARLVNNDADTTTQVTVNFNLTGSTVSQGPTIQTGVVTRDFWQNVSGSQLYDLMTDLRYPTSPDISDTLTSLEAVNPSNSQQTANFADNYGQRITGRIVAPETGDYTFWISSDDQSELWLSTDSTAGGKVKIAEVNAWTNQQQWDKEAGQQSATISLSAGESYYLEILHKEGGGGDNLTVGWRKPSDGTGTAPAEIVPGSVLTAMPVYPTLGDGQLVREFWQTSGWMISDLKNDADYPNNPDVTDTLVSFQSVNPNNPLQTSDYDDTYGERITGYIVPPESGDYTFWVSSDDQSELWLSTDSSASNLVKLAEVQASTGQYVWDHESGQMSTTVTLQAGQSYYVEAFHSEGGGGDHFAVGWRKPSDGVGTNPAEVIPGYAISTTVTPITQGGGGMPGSVEFPDGVTPNLLPQAARASEEVLDSGIDYTVLRDVTSAFDVTYEETKFDRESNRLTLAVSLAKTGATAVRGDLLLVVRRVRPQDTSPTENTDAKLVGYDGVLARSIDQIEAGTPFLKLSELLAAETDTGFYQVGASVDDLRLSFDGVSDAERFDYEVVLLGQTNEAPAFTSDPYNAGPQGQAYTIHNIDSTGASVPSLEITAQSNNELRYALSASDPDGDAYDFSLLTGPAGMLIEDTNGDGKSDTLVWTPTSGDVGSHAVRLRVTDELGLFDPTNDQLVSISVVENVANRPPQFTTDPVLVAYAAQAYVYDSDAFDADGDSLSYSLTEGPGGDFAIDAVTGAVTWTPTIDQIGQTIAVTLQVSDGQGGIDEQTYQVIVQGDPTNRAPVFTELPATHFVLPGTTNPLEGEVNPGSALILDLDPEELYQVQGASVRIPTSGQTIYTPPSVPAETMTVINETDPAELVAALLGNGGAGITVTGIDLQGQSGSGVASTGIFVNDDGTYGLGEYGVVVSSGNAADYGSGNFAQNGEYPHTGYEYFGEAGHSTSFGIYATMDQQSLLFPISGQPEHQDVTQLDITFDVAAETDTLYFNVVIGSEEWSDFVGQSYIDAFGLYVTDPQGNSQNIAFVDAFGPPSGHITRTEGIYNSSVAEGDPLGPLPINVNHPQFEQIAGTELDGILSPDGNPLLTFTAPVTPGSVGNKLTFIIADSDDSALDTTAYISSLGGSPAEPIDIELVASDGDSILSVTPIAATDILPGEEATFNFTLLGDGQAHAFDLLFRDTVSGELYGSIPVRINADYLSDTDAVDPDGDTISYSFIDENGAETLMLHGANIDAVTGEIQWEPTIAGAFDFVVQAEDGRGGVTLESYTVVVDVTNAGNQNPLITSVAGTEAEVGRTYVYDVQALDADGDKIKYYLTGAVPAGMAIDTDTGRISWVPDSTQVSQYDFGIRVTDGHGGFADESVSLTVQQQNITVNRSPQINSAPSLTVLSGETYRYQVEATDPDSDSLVFSVLNGPDELIIDAETGLVLWTATAAELGSQEVTLKVTDSRGLSTVQSYWLSVVSKNAAPEITSTPPTAAKYNRLYQYQVLANDPNGDSLTYGVDSLSESRGVTIDSNGLLEWTPQGVGTVSIGVHVSDGRGGEDTQWFDLAVAEPAANTPPRLVSEIEGLIFLNEVFNYQLVAEDIEDGTSPNAGLVFSLDQASLDRGMTVDPFNGLLTWTPKSTGTFTTTVTVTDSGGASSSQQLTLPVNKRPAVNGPATFISEPTGPAVADRTWTYAAVTTDPDGDDVTVELLEAPAWLDQSVGTTATGSLTLTGTPDVGGTYRIRLSVEDPSGAGQEQVFDLPVIANAPPIVVQAVQSAGAALGQSADYDITAFDANGDVLDFELIEDASTPGSGTVSTPIDNLDGTFTSTLSFTPDTLGTQEVALRVSDGRDEAVHVMTLNVIDSAEPQSQPTASLTARTATAAGELFSAQVEASDPNGDDLTYSISFDDPAREPVGMMIDPDTGRITWQPTLDDVTAPVAEGGQPYQFTVSVTDGNTAPVTIGPVDLTVVTRFTNAAPQITSDPTGLKATAGAPLVYEAMAVDPDGDPVTWSMEAGPSSASIDPTTGRFVWRPDTSVTVDQTFEARITATDPYGASSTQVIQLVTTAGNAAPRITSQPPQPGQGGDDWAYDVSATDPDGDAISFTLTGDTSGLTVTQTGARTARVTWDNPAAGVTKAFQVVVADARGLSSQQNINLSIGSGTGPGTVDTPPNITSTPVFQVVEGEAYRYRVTAEDPDGAVTYGLAAGAPAWLGIDSISGELTGTAPLGQLGSEEIAVTATQAGSTASQRFSVTVTSSDPMVNNAPVIEANDNLAAYAGSAFAFLVKARDVDGDPLTYTLIDANNDEFTTLNGISIDDDGRVAWDVPAGYSVPGTEEITIRVRDDQGATATRMFSVSIAAAGEDQPPSVALRSNTTQTEPGKTVTFAVDASDDLGIDTVYIELAGSFFSGGVQRLAVGNNGLARYTLPSGTAGETFTATAIAIDVSGNSSNTSPLTVNIAAPDTAAPVIRVEQPYSSAVIEEATDIEGAIFDAESNLVYYSVLAKDSSGRSTFLLDEGEFNGSTIIANLGDQTNSVALGTIDPLSLNDGQYTIELLAQDASGKIRSAKFEVTVAAPEQAKLGVFRQTFVDMQVPVAGLPISVQRTYDSLEADQHGDFGYGWSLDLLSGGVEVSNLADDDVISGDDFLGQTFKTPWQFATRVEFELPGGESIGFTAVPMTYSTGSGAGAIAGSLLGASASIYAIGFLPDSDALGMKLEFVGGQQVRIDNNFAEQSGLEPGTYISSLPVTESSYGALTTLDRLPFHPETVGWDYRLTTRDGRQFKFDSAKGNLYEFSDAYGNRLSVAEDSLTAYRNGSPVSTGGLTIQRDPANQNRITRIENALGYGVNYRYDQYGDLIGVDQEIEFDDPATTGEDEYQVNTITFGYQTPEAMADPQDLTLREHFLDEILDNEGHSLVQNEYDENGRLKSVTDGNDATTTVTYDDANRTQTTVDEFGRTTISTYDARGNVTRIEQLTAMYGGESVIYDFVYDENENLLQMTDPEGRITTYDYDSRDRLARVVAPHGSTEDPADFTTVYTYDDRTDQIATITDPNGRQERRTYNTYGDLLQLSDETGHVYSKWTYDSAGRVTSEGSDDEGYFLYRYDPDTGLLMETEDPNGNVIGSEYDALGQLKSFTDEDGQNLLTYDGLGREVSADYGDIQVDYEYDSGAGSDWTKVTSQSTGTVERHFTETGQLAGWTLANGGTVQYIYDRGRLDQEIDPLGRVTQYAYDDLGRVSRVSDLSTGNYVDYTYDKAGRVLSTTDASGNAVEVAYDAEDTDRQVTTNARGYSSIVDVDGLLTTLTSGVTLDGSGNPVSTPVTRMTSVERNAAGLPVRYVNADGSDVVIGYRNSDVLGDAEQSPVSIRDESGRVRRYSYLSDGRLNTSSDLAGALTTFAYDDSAMGDGRLQSVTGPTGETVTYGYDTDGRIVSVTRPGLGTTTITQFSDDSQPEGMTLADGTTVTQAYDGSGRLETRTTSTGETATYTYNVNDQLTSIVDNTGTTSYTYYSVANPQSPAASHAGKLQRIDQANGSSIVYTYDAQSRVSSVTTQASATDTARTTSYTYDENGNIETVLDPLGGLTSYTYDELDRLATRALPNGVTTAWTFDDRDRLLSLVHEDGSGGVLSSFTYEHPTSAVGEPHKVTREDGSYVELDYDGALRLEEERWYGPTSGGNVLLDTITYAYDAAGNRTSVTTNGQSSSYTADPTSDYLLSVVDAPGTADDQGFVYDQAGRLTQLTRDGETWTLGYNSLGQITTATSTSGRTLTYTYDAQGDRVGMTDSAAPSRNYLVAPPAQNLGVSIGQRYLEADTSGGLVNGWVYAGENAILKYDASGNASYYLEDAMDSVAALTDASGVLTAEYAYDAFGNLRPGSSSPTDFGYHGAVHDAATGLVDMRARTYDPRTGRFTSPDPVEPTPQAPESFNPYVFANGNPHLYSDPTGGFSLSEINVSQLISKGLTAVRQGAIQYAREEAKDALFEFATDALLSGITSLLPGGTIVNTLAAAGQFADEAGNLFGLGVRKTLCGDVLSGIGKYARFEVPINPNNGHVTGNGLGCGDSETLTNPTAGAAGVPNLTDGLGNPTRRRPIRPDAIFGPTEIINDLQRYHGNADGPDAYVVAEFKISLSSVRKAANRNQRQTRGIARYTDAHTVGREFAAFLALFSGYNNSGRTQTEVNAIKKKFMDNYGIVGVVIPLINKKSPFRGR